MKIFSTLITVPAIAFLLNTSAFAQSLESLIEAAKNEPSLTVYDSTGKIKEVAANFAAKYGLEAIGQKVSANSQLEMVIREAQAKNVKGDVLMITDTPAAIATLIPQGFVESWVPSQMKDVIPKNFHSPMTVTTNANVWAYNTAVYDSCPVTNIWQLTEKEWRGRVAVIDPLLKSGYTDWFNQMATYGNEAISEAYVAQYGKPLETKEATAAAAWIAAFAENGPAVMAKDDPISSAIGAPGQDKPFFGLISSAKFRDIAGKEYNLGICKSLVPWVGWTYSKLALIATGTDSPNAAKLFVHFVLTEEGIEPQMRDGKVPTNSTISMPENEPSGLMKVASKLLKYHSDTGLQDYDTRQDWQDFWRIHYSK